MPIGKIICNLQARDNLYELALAEKIMCIVQLSTGTLALCGLILAGRREMGELLYVLAWISAIFEFSFCVEGFVAIQLLRIPLCIAFLICLASHIVFRSAFVIWLIVQSHKANFHAAINIFQLILSTLQFWACILLVRTIRREQTEKILATYQYIPSPMAPPKAPEDIWR